MIANKLIKTAAKVIVIAALAAVGVLAVGARLVAPASAATLRSAVSSLPRLPAQARVLGALTATHRVRLTVSLKPRDPAALKRFATAVSTPGNPDYGRFLSVSQFATRFGAPTSHISAVRRALRGDGLSLGRLDRNHLTLVVSGSAGSVERAFDVSLFTVRLHGRTAFANDSAPTLPRSVAQYVQAVNGFDDVTLEHPQDLAQPKRQKIPSLLGSTAGSDRTLARHVPTNGGPQPCESALEGQQAAQQLLDVEFGAGGPLTLDQIATAYQFPALYQGGDFGQGQTIGLIEIAPFSTTDVATYDACFGITAKINTVNVGGGPAPTGDPGEGNLDIEVAQSLAPQATIDVYQGPADDASVVGTFSAAISANAAKVLSASIGGCEAQTPASIVSAENTLFQEAAAQGQSMFASSGDEGSSGCDTTSDPGDTQLSVDDPAAQPFVTAVGGTTLYAIDPSTGGPDIYNPGAGTPPVQAVWNEGLESPDGVNEIPAATGGGISRFSAMPSYQSSAPLSLGVVNSNSSAAPCGGTSFCREVPDVSADADEITGDVVYTGGQWTAIGGTSAASPLWAAWTAETNDLPACRGLTIGFENPSLYAIAGTAFNDHFTDIVNANPISGGDSNDAAGANNGLYPVATGYDMATGLGSMTSALADALCAARSPVYSVAVKNPGAQKTTVGEPVSVQIHATDSGGQALSYSATGLPAGLSISSSGVISGKPAKPGRSTVTVRAADAFGNASSTRFRWSVVVHTKQKGSHHSIQVTRAKLTGLAERRPVLTLNLAAAKHKPAIRSVSVTVPNGLKFATSGSRLRRGTSVRTATRTAISARVRPRTLTLTLRRASPRILLTIAKPELSGTRAVAAQVRRHRLKSLTIGLSATNAKHKLTIFSVKLKKLS